MIYIFPSELNPIWFNVYCFMENELHMTTEKDLRYIPPQVFFNYVRDYFIKYGIACVYPSFINVSTNILLTPVSFSYWEARVPSCEATSLLIFNKEIEPAASALVVSISLVCPQPEVMHIAAITAVSGII